MKKHIVLVLLLLFNTSLLLAQKGLAPLTLQSFNKHYEEQANNYYLYGLIDSTNTQILPCIYESTSYIPIQDTGQKPDMDKIPTEVRDYLGKSLLLKKDGKYGLVDSLYNEILSFDYDNIYFAFPSLLLVAERKNEQDLIDVDLLRRIDGQKHIVKTALPAYTYNSMLFLENNTVIVKKDKLYGLLSTDGTEILAVEYIQIKPVGEGLIIVQKEPGTPMALFNAKGEALTEYKYTSLDNFVDSISIFSIIEFPERYGLIDKSGRELLAPEYNDITRMNGFGNKLFKVRKGRNEGIVDSTGKLVIPLKYRSIEQNFGNKLIVSNRSYGIVDIDDRQIIPSNYSRIAPYSRMYIVKKDGLYGVLDTLGNNVLPLVYDEIRFSDYSSFIFTEKDRQWQIFDLQGKQITPETYSDIEILPNDHLAVFKADDETVGVINKEGDIIIPIKYKDIWYDHDGHYTLKDENEKWALFDYSGKQLSGFEYDDINIFPEPYLRSNLIIVSKNGKTGIIDNSNKTVVPFVYDLIESSYIGLYLIGKKVDRSTD